METTPASQIEESGWPNRPTGATGDYDSKNWPLIRTAWEFLRRNETYQNACDFESKMLDIQERQEYSEDEGYRWHTMRLTPYSRNWPGANNPKLFRLYGENYIDPKEESCIEIPKNGKVGYFRVNIEAGLDNDAKIELQASNILKQSYKLLEQLRKKNSSDAKSADDKNAPRPLIERAEVYGRYLQVLDFTAAKVSDKEILKFWDARSPDAVSDISAVARDRKNAMKMTMPTSDGYIKLVVAHRKARMILKP